MAEAEPQKSPGRLMKTKTADMQKEIQELEKQDALDPLNQATPRSYRSGRNSPRLSGRKSSTEEELEEEMQAGNQSALAYFFQSRTYEYIMLSVILLNCVSIVMQIEYPSSLDVGEWLIVNLIFFFIYLAEIILKSITFGFWKYIQLRWHQFDLFVTVLAAIQIGAYYALIDRKLVDEYNKYVSGDMVQILRLARLLRLARVFPELATLIQAFVASMKALLWISVMAIMWFYLCACAATVFIGRKEWLPTEANPEEPDDIREVRETFSTIPLSMFALFEVMTLEGWCDYVRPLLEARPVIVFAFLIFIFVSAFFMLNLVTAVVVDRTLTAQKEAKEEYREDAEFIEREHMDVLYEVMLQLNDGEDLVQRDKFLETIRNENVTKRLIKLGWNRDFMISIFSLIDHDDDGTASLLRMRKLWIACHQPLDTQTFVRFQINLAHRMEYTDKVAFTVLDAINKLSGKKLDLNTEDMKVKPSILSTGNTKQHAG
eukprot:gnl/MRDRNA2_/MRDRNA2_108435_c0_seq1.p1 gnl/MRDRNA2_/MRDRNA2_108435_c0~~gnl/MRDRNA2_/MRDRNA2_108435_c0_seq1.p1  ORF type:complete len:488 (+),score=88.49 gnl/MRDRNA2_/MRDRNA2_108435_c0_seq1:160-1623(+)